MVMALKYLGFSLNARYDISESEKTKTMLPAKSIIELILIFDTRYCKAQMLIVSMIVPYTITGIRISFGGLIIKGKRTFKISATPIEIYRTGIFRQGVISISATM